MHRNAVARYRSQYLLSLGASLANPASRSITRLLAREHSIGDDAARQQTNAVAGAIMSVRPPLIFTISWLAVVRRTTSGPVADVSLWLSYSVCYVCALCCGLESEYYVA